MAVLKSKRTVSKEEYEHSFKEMYQHFVSHLARVPKRRQKWLCKNLYRILNRTFEDIMEISEGYFTKGDKRETIDTLALTCIRRLQSLQKPLLVLWSIEKFSMRRMVYWVGLIHRVLDLLNKMMETPIEMEYLYVLDWNAIYKAKFMANMMELHRSVHGKVIKAPMKDDDSYNYLFVTLIDDALYELCEANRNVPKTAKEYQARRRHISTAISNLNKCQRPMVYFFSVHEYSNEVIKQMSKLLSTELKLLYGLNKSDKIRFSNLK